MNSTLFFEELWKQYTSKTPSAYKVKSLLENKGETVFNDHIAIRTFDDPRTHIEVLAKPFIAMGYTEMGEYHFETKKLYAKHYEHSEDTNAPKIFISQLLTRHFSDQLQAVIKKLLNDCDDRIFCEVDLILKGRVWETPSFEIYKMLQDESEYAAWMYVNGFCSNHFTVDVNKLEGFKNLNELNKFLKDHGFMMNTSGGEIKGTPLQFLEQSSILADKVKMKFIEGIEEVTSCYYEFAYRHKQDDGQLFTGFIANSADKIFESTDMKLQKA
ncbi:2-oxoadipate dioxygenase/decarboxylase family protein [Aquimarina sp. M1]